MTKSKAKIRGRIVKQGPVPPVEQSDPLAWLVHRLAIDEDGEPLMQGIFSNYNDDIVIEADQNTLLGRVSPGRGPAERLEIGDGLRVEDGVLIGEGGGEKGDPGPPGPPGPEGPEGPAGASSSMWLYRFDSSTQAMDPGAGRLRYNNATPANATRIYFDRLTQDGLDPTTAFTTAQFDDEFVIQRRGLSSQNQTWRLLAPAIDRTDWFEVWVEFVAQVGVPFTNNMEITIILRTRGEPGPQGPQGIQGPQGATGPQGAEGPRGPVGGIGPVGPQGAQGNTGPQGQQGVAGPKGDKGDVGLTGPKGDKGDKGDTGTTTVVGGVPEAPIDGNSYERQDGAWISAGDSAAIFVGDEPPNAPDNALWWEADSGILFVRYNDGDSSQWVQAAASAGVATSADRVSFPPSGSLAATNVQAALQELDAEKLPLAGGTMSGQIVTAMAWCDGPIASATPGTGGMQVLGDATGASPKAAYVTFHRSGSFAANFGLDTDNQWKVGGWSMGNVAYKLWHEGNLIAATAAEFRANAAPTKFLTSGAVWSSAAAAGITDAATITLNLSLGLDFAGTIGASRTMGNPSNGKAGQKGMIFLIGGSVTAWGTAWKFPGGIKPTSSGGVDVISYTVGGDNTSMYCTFAPDFK